MSLTILDALAACDFNCWLYTSLKMSQYLSEYFVNNIGVTAFYCELECFFKLLVLKEERNLLDNGFLLLYQEISKINSLLLPLSILSSGCSLC